MCFYVSLATDEGLQFFVPKLNEGSAIRFFNKIKKTKNPRGSVLLLQKTDKPCDVTVDDHGCIVKAPGATAWVIKKKVYEGASC